MMQTISQVSSTVSFITSSTDTGAVWSPLNGPEFVSSACFVWASEKASPNSGPPEDGGLGSLGVICFRCECKWTIQGTKAGREVALQRLTTVTEREKVRRCLMLLMQMLFVQRILQNSGLLSKTEQKKKENKTCSTWKLLHPSKCLCCSLTNRTWAPKAAASSFKITSPYTAVTLVVLGCWFVYPQPLLSRMFQEEELQQGRGHGRLCPLLRGVRRAGPHPNAAQLGFTVLECGIMGGLCRPGERAGLFLGMTACVFGPRLSVKSNLTASLTLAVPFRCLKHTSGTCTAVFYSLGYVYVTLAHVYRFYCYHVCPQPPQFRLFWGKWPHKQKRCLSGIRKVSRLHLEVLAKASVTTRLVRAYIQCTAYICRFSSRHPQILWNSKWITLLGFADEPAMNHAHSDSTSGDLLLWLRGP